jgi:hypothetical protein
MIWWELSAAVGLALGTGVFIICTAIYLFGRFQVRRSIAKKKASPYNRAQRRRKMLKKHEDVYYMAQSCTSCFHRTLLMISSEMPPPMERFCSKCGVLARQSTSEPNLNDWLLPVIIWTIE